MNEQNRLPQERTGGPPGLASIFADDDAADVMVTVTSGQNRGQLPVGNSTVSEIRQRFRDRFAIDPQSQAFINGHEAGEDAVVRAGQVLMFMRRSGEKGKSNAGKRWVHALACPANPCDRRDKLKSELQTRLH